MSLDILAQQLCDATRTGLSAELLGKLGLTDPTVTRGRLLAEGDGSGSPLGVYLLAAYVIDDTDFWGDGEIYWWSVPAMVRSDGAVTVNPLHGLPAGEPPHKVGSLEWMTNLSLQTPPLLAAIPASAEVAGCVVRLGFYDDDGKPADMAAAVRAGVEAYAALSRDPLPGSDQIILPVRDAIFGALKAQEDDILIDQDIVLRRGASSHFGSGMIGSAASSKIRVYYFVHNFERTERFGPITLHKGQTETVKFSSPLTRGGRLALFARGADVSCSAFGELGTDMPFINKIIAENQEPQLASGFGITGTGPAKVVAYYTPPG